MATKKSPTPKPAPQLKKLNFLIGKWHTQGELLMGTKASTNDIRGMDTYEWVSGGFFILHRVDVLMGDERAEAIEIIGYDEVRKAYFMKSFDSQGASLTMYAELEKPGVLKFGDKKMRSVLTAAKNGKMMSAQWELSDNGKSWKPWMTIQFHK